MGPYLLFLLGSVCVVSATGCVGLDAAADYERAQTIIQDHVGEIAIHTPSEHLEADERTVALLEDGLTIDEAVGVALLNNPRFLEQLLEIGVSRADVAQSMLLTNPTLSLSLQLPEGGGIANVGAGVAGQIAELWRIPVRKKIAEAQLEQAILRVSQQAVELATQVRSACYRLLAMEQALIFIEANLELAERTVALSEKQLAAGEISELDVNVVRVGALDVREELIAARGQLEQARAELQRHLGLGCAAFEIRLVDDLPPPLTCWPSDGALVDLALNRRLDLVLSQYAVKEAEAALQLECRRFLPDVQLGIAFERNERRSQPGRKVLADTARASLAAGKLTAPTIQSAGERRLMDSQVIDTKLGPTLAMTLPIFDQNQAQIAKARTRVLQARMDYESRAQNAAADVRSAVAAARAAANMLAFQQSEALALAGATARGAEQRYAAGERSLLALIEARDSLIRRRRTCAGALRDYAVALAQLEGALGGPAIGAAALSSVQQKDLNDDAQN